MTSTIERTPTPTAWPPIWRASRTQLPDATGIHSCGAGSNAARS